VQKEGSRVKGLRGVPGERESSGGMKGRGRMGGEGLIWNDNSGRQTMDQTLCELVQTGGIRGVRASSLSKEGAVGGFGWSRSGSRGIIRRKGCRGKSARGVAAS